MLTLEKEKSLYDRLGLALGQFDWGWGVGAWV